MYKKLAPRLQQWQKKHQQVSTQDQCETGEKHGPFCAAISNNSGRELTEMILNDPSATTSKTLDTVTA